MTYNNHYKGFTLIELMIAVAIIGILSAIAIPSYNSYIETSKTGVVKANAVNLITFQETYYYENETYLAGSYTPGGADTLTAALEWKPTADQDKTKYVVTAGTCGDITKCYTITASLLSNPNISQTISRHW